MSNRKPTVEIQRITPAMAEQMLRCNDGNRTPSPAIVRQYAEAMARGEWELNGESIQIDENGRLLNGQHRLLACRQAGVPFSVVVVSGVDSETFDSIDRGKRRTAADVLTVQGEKNATVLSAALRMVYVMENSGRPYDSHCQPTSRQLRELLEYHPDIREDAKFTTRARWCRAYLKAGRTAFLRFWFRQDNEDAAVSFFDHLESGAGMDENSPVLSLRERITLDSQKTQASRGTAVVTTAMVFRAYRMYRDGRKASKTMRVRYDGNGNVLQAEWKL